MSSLLYRQRALHLDDGQIRRYLGCRGARLDEAFLAQLREAKQTVENGSYGVCWQTLPVSHAAQGVTLGPFDLASQALARQLLGCRQAVLFCATLGPLLDRQLLASRLRPGRTLAYDAVGTAGIEQLCDDFCATLPQPQRPRFSPGYGDLPLEVQRPFLALLEADRLLGVSLTDALLMIPTKSVTAIVGLESA